MLTNKVYRYELDPNNIQRSSLAQHSGVARFAYNWGLEKRIARYKNNQGNDRFTDAMKQHDLEGWVAPDDWKTDWNDHCSMYGAEQTLKKLNSVEGHR